MNMKKHILVALREQLDSWVGLVGKMDQAIVTTARFDHNWSIKDVITHLWGWQQVSSARVEAAVLNCEPQYPKWITDLGAGWEENADQTNVWMKQSFDEMSWSEVYQHWREGYLRLIDLAERVAENDLLEGGRFDWLEGSPLVFILIASYHHHQEHYEKLTGVG